MKHSYIELKSLANCVGKQLLRTSKANLKDNH